MALYRITLTQTLWGQNVNNVFHYETPVYFEGSAEALVIAWVTEVMNAFNAVQNIAVSNISAYCVCLDQPEDYFLYDLTGGNGDVGTTISSLSPFNAWSFTYNTSGSIIKHGYKRVAGVDEGWVASGTVLSSVLPTLDALATKFESTIVGGGFDFVPVVARILEVDPVYVYLVADVASCIFRHYSTQNTRKNF